LVRRSKRDSGWGLRVKVVQVVGWGEGLSVPGAESFLDTGEVGIIRGGGEAGADRIKVDISHAGGDGGII